jgi:PmbA protein
MNLSPQKLAQEVVELAAKAGATSSEVRVRTGVETDMTVRNGQVEQLQQAGPSSIGIRLWVGDRSASTYSTDMRSDSIDRLIRQTLDLVPLTDPVAELALPDAAWLADSFPELELFDPSLASVTAEEKLARIKETEALALAADSRISTSGGASWGDLEMTHALANSHGFCHGYTESFASFSVQVIADDADWKKRNGSWYSFSRFVDDLRSPEEVAATAAKRALEQMGAAPMPTGDMPVVFSNQAAGGLVGTLFGCLTGRAIERSSSYLMESMGELVASELFTLIDDPAIRRGPGSRPRDGEGLPATRTAFIENGVLRTWALNSYSARKLGLAPTGHASSPSSGAPSETASNLWVTPGTMSVDELIADIEYGFFCDGMMGFGFNPTTGDFSRGAHGFIIEKGQLGRPVSEVTVSANFRDLFGRIDALANDLPRDRRVASPAFRVSSMTVAGS